MCGIGGYYRQGQAATPKHVREAVRTLWLALQDRGTHAAGLAVLGDDGGVPAILKAGAPASHIANMAIAAAFAGSLPPRWVILHTRHATHGGASNNLNNHPLGCDVEEPTAVCLVHNGVVTNKAAVLKALKQTASRSVDSEAVLACLRVGGVEKVAELCAGSMALTWNVGDNVHLWTCGSNPLTVAALRSIDGGGFMWASTRKHLEATGLTFGQIFDAQKGREYVLTPEGLRKGRTYEKKAKTTAAAILADWRTVTDYGEYGGHYVPLPKYRAKRPPKKSAPKGWKRATHKHTVRVKKRAYWDTALMGWVYE